MNEWPDASPPEWQQIQQMLHGTRPRRARAKLRRINWLRLSVSWMAMMGAFLLAYDVYSGTLAAWIAGLGIVLAAGCCWVCEWDQP